MKFIVLLLSLTFSYSLFAACVDGECGEGTMCCQDRLHEVNSCMKASACRDLLIEKSQKLSDWNGGDSYVKGSWYRGLQNVGAPATLNKLNKMGWHDKYQNEIKYKE